MQERKGNPLSEKALIGTSNHRVVKHTIFLTVSAGVTKLLLILFAIYATNTLKLSGFGQLEYYLNLVFIFLVLADFGLELWTTRELARHPNSGRKLIPNLLAFRTPFTLLGAAVLMLYLSLFSEQGVFEIKGILSIAYLVSFSFQILLRGMLRGYRLMGYEALLNLTEKVLLVGFGVLLIHRGFGVPAVLGTYLGANVLIVVCSVFLLRMRINWDRGHVQIDHWPEFLKGASAFGLAAVFITFFYRQDTILLKHLAGDVETGSYRSIYRLVEGLWMVPQMLAVALYPVMSELHHKRAGMERMCTHTFRFLLGIALPIAVGGTLVARDIVALIFPEHANGGFILAVMVWTMPFVYGNFLFGTVLAATNRQRVNLYASMGAVVINLVMNLYAIPRWGARGAAPVAVLTQASFFAMMFVPVIVKMPGIEIVPSLLKAIASVLLMGSLVWIVRDWGIWLSIPVGVIAYTLVAWSLGLIRIEDIKSLGKGAI